jgi:hypothetical protein
MLLKSSRGARATPPPVMTMGKAFLPIGTAVTFDFLGFIFSLFGIFGPLLAGIFVKAKTGSDIAGAVVSVGAFLVGGAGLQAFGMVMAMIVGFVGWMVVGIMLLISNRRIFKGTNALMFGSVLLIDEIPFINILPALSWRTIRMYRAQIKADKKALAEYEAQQKQRQIQMQQQQMAQMAVQQGALANQQAASEDDESLEQEEEQEKMSAVTERKDIVGREAGNDEINKEERLVA